MNMIFLHPRAAAERWNGVGSLLFTSSTAVYDVSDNGPCDEVQMAPPKTKSILNSHLNFLFQLSKYSNFVLNCPSFFSPLFFLDPSRLWLSCRWHSLFSEICSWSSTPTNVRFQLLVFTVRTELAYCWEGKKPKNRCAVGCWGGGAQSWRECCTVGWLIYILSSVFYTHYSYGFNCSHCSISWVQPQLVLYILEPLTFVLFVIAPFLSVRVANVTFALCCSCWIRHNPQVCGQNKGGLGLNWSQSLWLQEC